VAIPEPEPECIEAILVRLWQSELYGFPEDQPLEFNKIVLKVELGEYHPAILPCIAVCNILHLALLSITFTGLSQKFDRWRIR